MTTEGVLGFHHATAFASDAQRNVAFYVGVLGLRLVKRSVNQDAPEVYHLFYADAVGSPGTDLTFFPWRNIASAQEGAGLVRETWLAVPVGSLPYWRERIEAAGVALEASDAHALRFRDPDGLRLALVAEADGRPFVAWEDSPVPAEHQIRGICGAQMVVHACGATERVLTEILGFTQENSADTARRYRVGQPNDLGYGVLEVVASPEAPRGRWGRGCMHHLAWRVRDEAHLSALRERIAHAGLQPTPIIDRFWFNSVYFREPGGVIFELATDGPGFGVDESMDSLGKQLVLPPWLEPRRAEIEANLPPIDYPPTTMWVVGVGRAVAQRREVSGLGRCVGVSCFRLGRLQLLVDQVCGEPCVLEGLVGQDWLGECSSPVCGARGCFFCVYAVDCWVDACGCCVFFCN